MLPRLRFVVASIAIAILPMVLLGSGIVPTPPASASFENPRHRGTIALPAKEITEAQYRAERQAMSFARRSNELSRLREMASLPLTTWAADPAGSGGEAPAVGQPAAGESVLPPAAVQNPAEMQSPEATPAPAAQISAAKVAALATASIPEPAAAPETTATVAEPSQQSAPAAAAVQDISPVVASAPPAARPATEETAANTPAADTAANADPAPAVLAALPQNDVRPLVVTSSAMTQIVVVAPARKKAAKVRHISRARLAANRAAAAKRAAEAAAAKAQQQLGPFQFFAWLFGPKPPQPAVPAFTAPSAAAAPAKPATTTATRTATR